MKIFRLLPLSIHNISLYKFRYSIAIEQGTRSFKMQVVQDSTFIIKIGNIPTNNDNIKIRVKQINNASINDNNNNDNTDANNNNNNDNNDNKINSKSDNIETTTQATI